MKRSLHFKYLFCLAWACMDVIAWGMALPNSGGEATPIRLTPGADARVAAAAADLSKYLERIFSFPFPVTTTPGESGIILGTVDEYAQFEADLNTNIPGAKEGYAIKAIDGRLMLVGASPHGVQNAVWDFLHRLGYRHYFPGKRWEIIPKLENYEVDWNIVSRPSFAARKIFVTHNIWPDLREDFKDWQKRNRLDSGLQFSTGHSYNALIERHKEEFAKNPGYLTKPLAVKNNKFVIAEKGLRDLVVADAIAEVRGNPNIEAFSLDPSDGANWPESSPLGSVSNQAVTLANEVAAALQTVKPEVKVTMYAYSQHSPPPSIDVNPNVIVSVATAFLRDGFTFESLMKGWAARGASLGVRDYLGVWAWNNDLPGRGLATSPDQVAKSFSNYYELGARYYTAESNHGFGAGGLGLYIATRCLWDVKEAADPDAIRKEFLEKSFGTAQQAMAKFYQVIDKDSSPLLSEHLLGSMYRALSEAYSSTSDEAVTCRIDDLAAYTRYVELFRDYQNADPKDKQDAFDVVAAYGKRIRSLGMAHTWALLRNQPKRDPHLKGRGGKIKDVKTNIESYTLPTHEEIKQWVTEGIARNQIQSFKPVSFSTDLVPLSGQKGAKEGEGSQTITFRGENNLYTFIPAGGSITFSAKGGTVHGDRGPISIKLYPALEPLGQSVAEVEVPADKVDHPVRLKSTYGGLHRIEFQDGNDQTTISWPAHSLPLAIPSGSEEPTRLEGRYTLYFYVPKGTPSIAGYSDNSTGVLIAANGSIPFRFSEQKGPGYFDIIVPAGQDGKVWSLSDARGKKLLMTVPSYLAPSKDALLVPKEALRR